MIPNFSSNSCIQLTKVAKPLLQKLPTSNQNGAFENQNMGFIRSQKNI